jgi:hypothetical protein
MAYRWQQASGGENPPETYVFRDTVTLTETSSATAANTRWSRRARVISQLGTTSVT